MSAMEDFTLVELKNMARELGITGFSTMNKAELVAALREEPDQSEPGKLIPIEKRMSGRWWCPVCDSDQPTEVRTCQVCGAVREGTSVWKGGA